MPTPDPNPPAKATGAGAPIVLSIVAGVVIGFLMRQPTVGFLIGAIVGVAIAGVLWLRDSRAGR